MKDECRGFSKATIERDSDIRRETATDVIPKPDTELDVVEARPSGELFDALEGRVRLEAKLEDEPLSHQ